MVRMLSFSKALNAMASCKQTTAYVVGVGHRCSSFLEARMHRAAGAAKATQL
jgi:hypothetical protein